MEPRNGNNHKIDPITRKRREEQFNPHGNHVPMDTILEKIHNNHSGINTKLYSRILRGIPKVEKIWKIRLKSPEETRTAQALLVSRIASEYADYGVKALRSTGVMTDRNVLIRMGINPNDINKEKRAWDYYYNGAIDCFSKDARIKNRQDIHDKLVEIDRVTGMSEKLYKARKRHWKTLSKILNRIIGQKQNPEKNLLAEVRRVIQRSNKDYYNPNGQSIIQARALDICLSVSIYADIIERTEAQEWPTAYTEGMLKVWPLLKENPELIHTIAEIE
jgi:hypothetical protein